MSRKARFESTTDPLQLVGRVATIGTFGLFVIVAAYYVDGRFRYQTELAEQDALIALNSEQQMQLEQYRSESEKWESTLQRLQQRVITEDELASVQDRLIDLAKENECKLKKIAPRGTSVRELHAAEKKGGEPLEAGGEAGQPTQEFDVLELGLNLTSEGDLQNTLRLLDAIHAQPWMVSTRQMTVRRDPAKPANLSMELELTFSSLRKNPSARP